MVTGDRLRVLEAMCALLVARLLLRAVPFRWIAGAGGGVSESDDLPGVIPGPTAHRIAGGVGLAIRRASPRLPGRSTCLAEAVAGRLMLAWRGVPSTLVLGVTKSDGALQAHAWLVVEGGIVCGGREVAGFRPIAAFRR
jgi:hypothetical protein